jgi:transposase-like protein
MDTSSSTVMDAASSRKGSLKRHHRRPELKRQIVEETLVPGASGARAHGGKTPTRCSRGAGSIGKGC